MKTYLAQFAIRINLLLALFGIESAVFAQNQPQIVWSTNAHMLTVSALAFSKDGSYLASGGFGTGHVWRVSNRSIVRSFSFFDDEGISGGASFAFSSDNALVAMGGGSGRYGIWRLPTGEQVYANSYGMFSDSVDAVCFSPDDRFFAKASNGRGVGIAMTPDGSTPLYLLRVPGFPYSEENVGDPRSRDIRFSPDGQWLAVGFGDHTARIYRLSEGYPHRDLAGHSDEVTSVDFSPDGHALATISTDGDARLWNVADGELVRIIRGGGGGRAIGSFYSRDGRFSADGKSLLTLSNGAVRFWSVPDGRLLLTYPDLEASSVAVAPDGKHFAYGKGSLTSSPGTVVMARWPLLVTGAGVRTNAMHLDWQGGTGLYQVEQRTNLSSGVWEAIAGPSTNTKLQVPLTNPAAFFRIQSLTNAP